MGRPRVELIWIDSYRRVRSRRDCGHRHRSLDTALECAKKNTYGTPSDGGDLVGVVYDSNGNIVSQARVFWVRTSLGGRSRTHLLEPGDRYWIEIPEEEEEEEKGDG